MCDEHLLPDQALLSEAPTPSPVMIVVTDQFADWEAPLIAAVGKAFYGLTVSYATPGGGSVTSLGGLTIDNLPDVQPIGNEVIVLCGGDGWLREDAPDLSQMLRDARARGQTIAGICAATIILGRAGLLNRVDHTSNGIEFIGHYLPDHAGRDHYRDVPHAVSDGGVITAPGTAPVSFAHAVFAAAGISAEKLAEFRAMMAAEHLGASAAGTALR